MEIVDVTQWRRYESVQWTRAVRYRGLELRSLDLDERILVYDAIASDLERRKREQEARTRAEQGGG